MDGVRGEDRRRFVLVVRDLGGHRFELIGWGPTGAHAVTADDPFEALRLVRQEVEPLGWRLAVQGSRRDTWPSEMLRDQLDRAAVYVLPADPTVEPETVATFDPAPEESLATIAEQEAAWEAWRRLPR